MDSAEIPGGAAVASDPHAALAALDAAVARMQSADWSALPDAALLESVRNLEVLRRRVDHATARLVDQVDRTQAHATDGHRTTKAALQHLGRLSGAEALGHVRSARALRRLPSVDDAYAAGRIPTAMIRAIARTTSNPRVRRYLDDADPIFAEQAACLTHGELVGFLRDWEALADADGAARASERNHRNRRASLAHNDLDGSWHLRADLGALQGAAFAEVLGAFEAAEFDADRAEAIARLGENVSVERFPRTPGQRQADALLAMARRAAASPDGARAPEPLVNIVVDETTFENELRRLAGAMVRDDPARAGERACRTLSGAPLHPGEALAAALVGTVRRVVVDSAANVIDVGRRRRLFTGTGRHAAELQSALATRGASCLYGGCNAPRWRLQVDHHRPWRDGGGTDVANSALMCGHHNRLKDTGYRPVRGPDGRWTIHRPDGSAITPAA